MKTLTTKRRKATPTTDAAVPTGTITPTVDKRYRTLDPAFVKALAQICERLKLVEDQLFARYQADGDLLAAQLWLEAQNQWRIGHGLLQRLTAPAALAEREA
jgi:hypothetical protein